MKTPKISVIIPVYNTEKYLDRCIQSIFNQTFTDFELLLINDGSTDRSGEICDEYAKRDKCIRVFHKENGGVSSARNLGLDEARGEWITFVDSDDYIASYHLSDLYTCTGLDIGLVVQSLKHIRENGEMLYDYCLPKGEKVYAKSNFACMVKEQYLSQRGYTASKLFKTEQLNKQYIRFNTEVRFCEDWIFLFSYLNAMDQKVCCSPVSNYFYVDRGNSLSHAENDFTSEYTTFSIIKGLSLEFCSRYNANVRDLDPTYMLHKTIMMASSKVQLQSIKSEDWDFFRRYYQATSMKTTVDKWIINRFHSYPSVFYLYLYHVRNFRKFLERHNLWTIVNLLRK